MNAIDELALDRHARLAGRNVLILAGAQALLGAAAPLTISLGSLAGYQLLGADKSLSTVPVTGFNVGVALGAIAIAFIAQRLGRKLSFIIGALAGAIGGALATIALIDMNFWLFTLALALVGLSSGFTQKIRFAAADASPSHHRARAISFILGAGIVSAVIGPQLAIRMKDYLEPIPFAGAYLMLVPLMLAAMAILAVATFRAPSGEASAEQAARPLAEIAMSPRFIAGLACAIGSYALMSFLMTGAPLAMVVGCGFSSDLATLGIQWHVIAMFAPSFFTGVLIARFGAERLVAVGFLILMACAVVAHLGVELWNFWGALVLLGIGWNFGFIGATAMVAASYRPAEADKVQGLNDIILFSVVAIASATSGQVFASYGWNVMNLAVWPVSGLCLALLFTTLRRDRAQAAAASRG